MNGAKLVVFTPLSTNPMEDAAKYAYQAIQATRQEVARAGLPRSLLVSTITVMKMPVIGKKFFFSFCTCCYESAALR